LPEKIFGGSDLNISLTKIAKILTLINYLVLFFCVSL
jgi:hypothetical protein